MVATDSATKSSPAAEDTADAIKAWLKDRFAESGVSMFVIALSGGIDSAVVCGLCARAVGPERVIGVIMPSSSNLDDAVSARKVAEAFGIKALTVDLTPVSDVLFSMLPDGAAIAAVVPLAVEEADQLERQKLAKANVHPRLRMTTVYYVANLVKGIVVGTGNKSEAMVGYFTKYGDGGVDLLPIIDLYKHEVRAVARHIGVPQSVIDRPPSAGLWQGQTDEDEIGLTYEVLDDALSAIESGDTSLIEPATLQRIKDMNRKSEHKRKPIPGFRRSAP